MVRRYTLAGKAIDYTDEEIEAFNNPYGGYTVGSGTNPLTGIDALTYSSDSYINPSFSTGYKMQPGFTAGRGDMGYNIPSAQQGVSTYNVGQDLSTNMANPFSDYLPQEFLETTPTAVYYSSPAAADFYTRPSGQIDPTKKKFYQQSFQEIYNEYLGKLGSMAREGETPDLRFTDYLSQAEPFKERFERQTPYQRGISNRAFAPSTRFIYY